MLSTFSPLGPWPASERTCRAGPRMKPRQLSSCRKAAVHLHTALRKSVRAWTWRFRAPKLPEHFAPIV
eukprot:11690159-Alexandrium_andersonii.AAC.1